MPHLRATLYDTVEAWSTLEKGGSGSGLLISQIIFTPLPDAPNFSNSECYNGPSIERSEPHVRLTPVPDLSHSSPPWACCITWKCINKLIIGNVPNSGTSTINAGIEGSSSRTKSLKDVPRVDWSTRVRQQENYEFQQLRPRPRKSSAKVVNCGHTKYRKGNPHFSLRD